MKSSIISLVISFMFINISIAEDTAKTYLLEFKTNLTSYQKKQISLILPKADLNSWKVKLNNKQFRVLKKLNVFSYIEEDVITYLDKPIAENKMFNSISANDWHLQKVNAYEAWKVSEGNKNTVIAICDSGINNQLKQFSNRVLSGHNFIDNDSDTSPNTNHGTAVAGFAASAGNGTIGSQGIAPKVSILPGKIVTTKGGVPTSAMLGCIRWAADKGAKVINVSMTGVNNKSSHSAAKYAYKKGAVVVWAGGNQNWRTKWKDKREILAVAASDFDDNRYYAAGGRYGSNTGHFVDITAPGEDVYHLNRDGSYGRGNGTSYSAPIVTGVLALMFSVNPKLTPEMAIEILLESSYDLNNEWFFGSGLVDAKKALLLTKGTL